MSKVCHLVLTFGTMATTSSDQMALVDAFKEVGSMALPQVMEVATIMRKVAQLALLNAVLAILASQEEVLRQVFRAMEVITIVLTQMVFFIVTHAFQAVASILGTSIATVNVELNPKAFAISVASAMAATNVAVAEVVAEAAAMVAAIAEAAAMVAAIAAATVVVATAIAAIAVGLIHKVAAIIVITRATIIIEAGTVSTMVVTVVAVIGHKVTAAIVITVTAFIAVAVLAFIPVAVTASIPVSVLASIAAVVSVVAAVTATVAAMPKLTIVADTTTITMRFVFISSPKDLIPTTSSL